MSHKIKRGDEVEVMRGQDRGKRGKVLQVLKAEDRVVIEGVRMVKRHSGPTAQNRQGGIIEKEAPIHRSNVRKIAGA